MFLFFSFLSESSTPVSESYTLSQSSQTMHVSQDATDNPELFSSETPQAVSLIRTEIYNDTLEPETTPVYTSEPETTLIYTSEPLTTPIYTSEPETTTMYIETTEPETTEPPTTTLLLVEGKATAGM